MTLPKPCMVPIPVVSKDGAPDEISHPVVNPLELVESIYRNHRHHFHDMFGQDPAIFWSKLQPDDPKFGLLDELRGTPGWQDVTYPFSLHGDGARFTHQN